MQVGRVRRGSIVAALGAAAYNNPYGAATRAYQVGKRIYDSMPKRKSASKKPKMPKRKRTKKPTRKAAGGAGSLRQGRRRRYPARGKCRTLGRRKLNKKVCRNAHAIKRLTYSENASLGTFTHRKIEDFGTITAAATGAQGVSAVYGHVMDDFNESVAYLQYYDPATPGTLVTADGKTGTFDRRFLFKSVYCSLVIRNNYQTDCHIKVYLITPKGASSIAPLTAWGNGITANPDSTITATTTIGQYPNDYSDFKDVWTAKLHCKAALSAGQTMTCSHGFRNVEYDPTAYASHSASFQQKYKNFGFIIIVTGTIAHTATTTGFAAAGVDAIMRTTRVITYDAGANISFHRMDNSLGDQTTASVQSTKPVADNIPYSTT